MSINKNLIAVLMIAVGLFLFFFLVLAQYDIVSATREAVKEREQVFTQRQSAIASIKQLQDQQRQRQGEIKKILVFLPDQSQNDQIISSVQAASSQTGIQLRSLTTTKGTEDRTKGYLSSFINIEAIGTYTTLLSFLDALEANLRLYDIQEINLSKVTGTADQLNISLKMNAYNLVSQP